MQSPASRRQFLKTASAGAAMAFTATKLRQDRGSERADLAGPHRLRRSRLRCHMKGVHPHDKEQNVEFTAVSDPWKQRRERAAARAQEWYGRPARQFVSYRDIVALKDIRRGDDRLVRSPTLPAPGGRHQGQEGRLRGETAGYEHGDAQPRLRPGQGQLQVVQMGTQGRSYPTSAGCRKLFQSGAIGKVTRIEQCRNGGKPYWYSWMERAEPVKAEDVDWKEFLMDRPMRPFDAKLLTGWYGFREFTDGPIANLGCHFIAMNNFVVGSTLPLSCVAQGGTFTWKDQGFTCPDHCEAVWVYPEGYLVHYSTNFGNSSGSVTKIYGDEGTIDLGKWQAPTYSSAGAIKPSKAPKVDTPSSRSNVRTTSWTGCSACARERRPSRRSRPATTIASRCSWAPAPWTTGKRQIFDPQKRDIREASSAGRVRPGEDRRPGADRRPGPDHRHAVQVGVRNDHPQDSGRKSAMAWSFEQGLRTRFPRNSPISKQPAERLEIQARDLRRPQ